MKASPVDEIDLSILRALQEDARASAVEVARAAGVSRATVYARLTQLRESGVIRGLTVAVDPHKVGNQFTAVLMLKSTTNAWLSWNEFIAKVGDIPEIEYCAEVAGEFDILLLLRLRDTEHLREFIETKVRNLAEVSATRTLMVMHEHPLKSWLVPAAAPTDAAASAGLPHVQ